MVTEAELEALRTDLESDRAERKASVADAERIRATICAFANDMPDHRLPGVLFIGIHDDGTCANLTIDDELLTRLAQFKSDGKTVPPLALDVRRVRLTSCTYAAIIVHPADAPPVRTSGRVYVRVGPTTQLASPQQERMLSEKRRYGNLPFDVQPMATAKLDDLDLLFFQQSYLPSAIAPDVLDQNERPLEQQLQSLRFTDNQRPTTVGILATGIDPTRFIPGAYIQFVRFAGTDLSAAIGDQAEMRGKLLDMLKRINDKLVAHNSMSLDITSGPTDQRKPEYPIAALQQLIYNAVMHRTYDSTNAPVRVYWFDDRIEISNPGGPYGILNVKNFGQPGLTDYRNPNLAEVMKNLGFVQRFGVGLNIVRSQLAQNGNPEVEWQVHPEYVAAIIRKRP